MDHIPCEPRSSFMFLIHSCRRGSLPDYQWSLCDMVPPDPGDTSVIPAPCLNHNSQSSDILSYSVCWIFTCWSALSLSSLIHPAPELSISATLNSSWVEVRLLALGIPSVYALCRKWHPCHLAAYKLSWQMMLICKANMAFLKNLRKLTSFPKDCFFMLTVFSSILLSKNNFKIFIKFNMYS